jgi:phosphatidylglycerophosphate synthase
MRSSLPNALSILRVVISFPLIVIYSGTSLGRYSLGIALIGLALITDVLDGYLARCLGVASELGYILDGLGDRAIYVSLILTFVAHNKVNLIIAWLLIFREVLIYAFRLLSRGWYSSNATIRRFSRWHAAGIRVWFLSYLLSDGVALTCGVKPGDYLGAVIIQNLLALITISISYYGLYRMFAHPPTPVQATAGRRWRWATRKSGGRT